MGQAKEIDIQGLDMGMGMGCNASKSQNADEETRSKKCSRRSIMLNIERSDNLGGIRLDVGMSGWVILDFRF